MSKSPPVLEAAALSKTYRLWRRPWRREDIHAVRSLDLVVREGEAVGLLGPNGAGKTTTLQLLLGLLPATTGKVTIFGKPPASSFVRSRLGYLPEESHFHPFLTGAQTLSFYAGLFPALSGAERRARCAQMLDFVGIDHAADRTVGEYSKGMRRRLGLAQALVGDPALVVLDEPTSGLDPIGAREVKDLVLRLKQQGKSVLLSSHLLADVQDVVDRVAILHRGRLLQEGALADLLSIRDRTTLEFVSMGERAASSAIRAAKDAGAKLASRGKPHRGLEEHFLEVVAQADAEARGD